jgi:asparagine synthase (glutamine-hydrolysing)
MCGISGSITKEKFENSAFIKKTLFLMKRRGPDNQSFYKKKQADKSINLLHSRLNIIDVKSRSNQPMTIGEYTIIFNGEIYNYIELKEKLKKKNYTFKTTSDTEVLLNAYIEYGEKCVDHFIGMWAFAIWDNIKKKLFLSRDIFGEKPLYYFLSNDEFFFGSEIKFIKSLSNKNFKINKSHINKNLFCGYKSLFKTNETFFEKIYLLENSTNLTIDLNLNIVKKKYWSPKLNIDYNLDEKIASMEINKLIQKSLNLRMRSDVPIAFCLSGGIDSTLLASQASKKLNREISTFSIIDQEPNYNEIENIKLVVKDLGCKNTNIFLKNKKKIFFKRLKELTSYHDGPISTISYYIHSFLSEEISKKGYKVAISGTGADEIFTGYYDHYLLHLQSIYKLKSFKKNLENWYKYVFPYVRNPYLKDPYVYIRDKKNRENVYESNLGINTFSRSKNRLNFTENKYSRELLRNRMLNELFHEVVPVILKHDDLNSMFFSIENRSPYLDRKIVEFSLKVPSEILIKNGYQKRLLRESSKNILLEQIRLDRQKKGFNASISSVLDLNDKQNINRIFNKNNPINDFVNLKKLRENLDIKFIPNHYSKLLFSIITTNLFLQENNY